MANEAEIINNPDSTPGAVSTGYQLQNTNLVSQRTGVDKTYVSGGAGTVTVEISGPVDVNGVLYNVKSQTVLTPPSAGRYYITLQGAGPQYLTPTLGTSAGTFDPLKNARYDASNYRVLNWVIYFDGTDCYANRLLTPENEHTEIEDLDAPEEEWITVNSNWIAPRSKYYMIEIIAAGAPGALGASGNAVTTIGGTGGSGGGGGGFGKKRIFINAGDVWTGTFGTSNTTFTDGTNSIIIGNGSNASSGYDFLAAGASGSAGAAGTLETGGAGGSGGKGIIYNGAGGGGGGGGFRAPGTNGGGGTIYGGGGGGGGGGGTFSGASWIGGSGGTGGGGFIHIIG